jgi:hypothetical protein
MLPAVFCTIHELYMPVWDDGEVFITMCPLCEYDIKSDLQLGKRFMSKYRDMAAKEAK